MDRLYDITLVIALWATGLSLGLSADPRAFVSPLRRRRMVATIAALDVVAIPLVVWGLTRLLGVTGDAATGLLLVGIAAAGPLGITICRLAGGNARAAVSYVVVLELLNAIAIPVWVALLLPAGVRLSPGQLLVALVGLLVAPVVVGVVLSRWRKGLDRFAGPLARVANLLVVVIIALSIARYHRQFSTTFTSPVVAVAALSTLFALGAGWMLCGPAQGNRIMGASITAVRSNGVALAVAQASFPDRPQIVASAATFGLCSVLLPAVAAFAFAGRPRARRTFPARRFAVPDAGAKRSRPPA